MDKFRYAKSKNPEDYQYEESSTHDLKIYLDDNGRKETRRAEIKELARIKHFKETFERLFNLKFKDNEHFYASYTTTYIDSDEDFISFSSDEELQRALRNFEKLYRKNTNLVKPAFQVYVTRNKGYNRGDSIKGYGEASVPLSII